MLGHSFIATARHLRGGRHSVTLLLSFALCLTAGCQKKTETKGAAAEQANQQAGPADQNTTTLSQQGVGSNASALDRGDLKLRYQSRKNMRADAEAHAVGSNQQTLRQLIDDLNARIALPFDIT